MFHHWIIFYYFFSILFIDVTYIIKKFKIKVKLINFIDFSVTIIAFKKIIAHKEIIFFRTFWSDISLLRDIPFKFKNKVINYQVKHIVHVNSYMLLWYRVDTKLYKNIEMFNYYVDYKCVNNYENFHFFFLYYFRIVNLTTIFK